MLNILKQVQDFKNPSIKYKIDIFSVSDHIGIHFASKNTVKVKPVQS